MFTTRLRNEIPLSVKVMMDALMDKKYLVDLNLAHNACGPDVIKSIQPLLEKCATLKVLDVTNCGTSPKGGEMLAEAIAKND